MQSFKKYMTFMKDFNAIVMHLLNQLVMVALHFKEIVYGSNKVVTHIDVKVEELQSKVLDYGIMDLKAVEFGRGNFELDEERSVIRHHLVRFCYAKHRFNANNIDGELFLLSFSIASPQPLVCVSVPFESFNQRLCCLSIRGSG
ncbi:hypothetical protein Ccrd_010409, partial [Cynara cardunculus var. scolymus]